jgi:predicted site-specific integrase-resolvase
VRYSCHMNEADCYVDVAGEPHLLLGEVVRRLKINRRTAYRWRDTGKLTHRTYLGRVCCPVAEVVRLEVEKEASRA